MRCVIVFSVQPTSPRPRPIFFIKTKRPRVTRYLPHIGSQKSPSLGSFFSPPVFSACALIAAHHMATKSSLLDRISEVGAALSHPHRHLTPMVAGPRSPNISFNSSDRWWHRGAGSQILTMLPSLRLHFYSTRMIAWGILSTPSFCNKYMSIDLWIFVHQLFFLFPFFSFFYRMNRFNSCFIWISYYQTGRVWPALSPSTSPQLLQPLDSWINGPGSSHLLLQCPPGNICSHHFRCLP